jgi:hypothetical protein
LGVALVALFMSLGGAGYAATQLAANSVGTDQIRNDAVTYQKIEPDSVGRVRLANGGVINSKLAKQSVSFDKIQPQAVGRVRANLNQLQARVAGSCATGSALGSIDNQGKATCNSTRAAEFGTSNATPVKIAGTRTNLATLNLPAGSTYMAFANPTVTVTSAASPQRVTVSCTMTVGNAASTRKVVVATDGTAGDDSTASIPLQLPGPAGTSAVSCAASLPGNGALPTITADTWLNVLQTASNS